jgi:hypothetical protein
VPFQSTIDADEFALIEQVGRMINPTAWDDPRQYKRIGGDWLRKPDGSLIVDDAMTETVRGINERNRQIACEQAMEIIACVKSFRRDGGATPGQ